MKFGIGLIILSLAFVDSSQDRNHTVYLKEIDVGTDTEIDSSQHIDYTEATTKIDFGTDTTTTSSQHINSTEKTKKITHSFNISAVGERRRLTFFPKNAQKFVVTMKPIEARNKSNPFIKPLNKIPMLKLIPRVVKIRNENYWKHVTTTRQPLMKFTKFTVTPLITHKISTHSRDIAKETVRKYKSFVINKMMNASKKDSSEERTGTVVLDGKQSNVKEKHVNRRISPFHKIRSRVVNKTKKPEQVSKPKETDSKLHTSSEFSSEEREDKEEFIFVEPKEIKENAVKVIKDSSESEEVTTDINEHETKTRDKRSNNVIEEENLGTTVSGFKFTGKVASLSSDLIFRNINT